MSHHREVIFEGIGNARDLGGISVGDKQIRHGKLLRTASLCGITKGDEEKIKKEYNPFCIVDLRTQYETEQNPDPHIPGVINYCFSVLESEFVKSVTTPASPAHETEEASRLQWLIDLTSIRDIDDRLYILFLNSDKAKKAYADYFRILLSLPEDRGIVWHCKDGKDRTGIAAMLLLSALGASKEVIMEDYLLTNDQNEKLLQKIAGKLEEAEIHGYQKENILFLSGGVQERFMKSAMDWLDESYGGALGYLASECMIYEEAVKSLREKYLVDN